MKHRMKGGNLVRKLTKRIQIDFPHQPFPFLRRQEDTDHGICGAQRYRVADPGLGGSRITTRVSWRAPRRSVTPISPTSVRTAYIVNTDPAGEPGQHWLGLWTEQYQCEIFDSYGLPLHVYTNPELHQWWGQWKHLIRSDIILQAIDSRTCGHYALFFLKARAQGQSYQDFLGQWRCDNLVLNDHKVAERLKRLIKQELQDEVDARPDGQKKSEPTGLYAL